MLRHHVDATDDIATSLACSLFDFRNALPAWLPLEVFIRLSDHNPLDKIPRHLSRSVLRLAKVFDGGKMTRDSLHWQTTFELFVLESPRRSPFSIKLDPMELDQLCATTSLDIMAKELRFNICGSPSSFLRNKDVPNLEALKRERISSHLGYACRHWADQVSKVESLDPDLLGMLSAFFQTHFLRWLEVMSILNFSPVEALKNLDPERVSNPIVFDTTIYCKY